jgi:hypothetical protein
MPTSHRPPHFHIVAPDFQVLVRISDLTVIAGDARPAQIVEVIAWARAHRERLALKWAELNERGRWCRERFCRASSQ